MDNNINLAVLYNYFFQGFFGLFMFLVLLWINRNKRTFQQKLWATAWIGYSLYSMFSAITLTFFLYGGAISNAYRLIFSVLAVSGSILEVVFLTFSILIITGKVSSSQKNIIIASAIALVIGLSLTLPFSLSPQEVAMRLFLRVGVKTAIMGLILLYASGVLYASRTYTKGIGSKALTFFLVMYAIVQLSFAFIRGMTFFQNVDYMAIIGYLTVMTDFIAHAFIALSMVLWLFETENQNLKRTNEQLDNFLYSTSHDLRAPISSIMGLVNLARIDGEKGKIEQYLSMIKDRILHLDTVINDILNYSRISRTEPVPAEIDLKKMIESVFSELRYMPGAAEIEGRIRLEHKNELRTDEGMLKIILSNLVSNSVKYSDPNKKSRWLEISTEDSQKNIVITLRDNGIGIRPDLIGKIFNMFFRATTNSSGTGLGLHIVKQNIEKLNGKITVESKLNEYSEFKIILPG